MENKSYTMVKAKVVNHLLKLIKGHKVLEVEFSGKDDHRMTFQMSYNDAFGLNEVNGIIDVRTAGLGLFQFSLSHFIDVRRDLMSAKHTCGLVENYVLSLPCFNINKEFVDFNDVIGRLAYELYDLVRLPL